MEGSPLNSLDLIYADQSGKVQIFRCWDEAKKKVVCLKEQVCETIQEFNAMLKEGINQTSLLHPGICKLYECFLKQEAGILKCAIVMEWMERDLQQEIEARRKTNSQWSEIDFLEIMYILVDALAYAQEQDICHRDIKPHNIFINHSGSVKVGDFGSSIRNEETEGAVSSELAGTPLYLSPTLRAKYLNQLTSDEDFASVHNPYKSDVYSLGISFIAMANLQSPDHLATLDSLEEKLEATIVAVPYSESVRKILRMMLKVTETQRPDFVQLREKFRELTGFAPTEEAGQQTSRKGIFKKCVFCNKRLIQKLGYEEFRIVRLPCDPRNHVFCSVSCFQSYVRSSTLDYRMDLDTVICPKKKCKASIPPTFTREQFGGADEVARAIEVLHISRNLSIEQRSSHSDLSPVKMPEEVQSTPTDTVAHCGECGLEVDLSADEDSVRVSRQMTKPVKLQCGDTHVFCRRRCFSAYLKKSTANFMSPLSEVKCPTCSSLIGPDSIEEYLGGKQKLERVIAESRVDWMACNECKDNKVQVTFKCGHGFCKLCIRGRYEVYRIQGKRNWLCPVCKAPMHGQTTTKSFCILS